MDHDDGRKDRWFYEPEKKSNCPQANELAFGRIRLFLYESLYRCVTKHNLYECFHLVKLLPKVISLDPYILFRFVMILVESNSTNSINKNVVLHLETLISKLYINKPDIFIEFLAYFIKNNRIDHAKELFSQRNKYMTANIHQRLPSIDVSLRCYEFLFNYLQWAERLMIGGNIQLNCDVSFQGKLVNFINCLSLNTTNIEYFVMRLIRILLHSGYYKKVYLIASEFQRNNTNNLSAQLILLYVIEQLNLINDDDQSNSKMIVDTCTEDQISKRTKDYESVKNFATNLKKEKISRGEYPISEDRRIIMQNLKRLDPSRGELLGYLNKHENLIDKLRDLMDGMEVLEESRNMLRWMKLQEVVNNIFDSDNEILKLDARFLWQTRYRQFWRNIDFRKLAGNTVTEEDKELISKITLMITNNLDVPIEKR